MTTPTFTPKQVAALAILPTGRFKTASAIGASPAVLTSLANLGLLERRWENSSLRGGEHWSYRINALGISTSNKLRRDAKKAAE